MKNSEKIVKKTLKYCPDTTFAYPLVIKSGKGCWIEDVDGKKYLDFNSNVCSCPIGYGNREIIEVIREFTKISANKVAGQDFFTEEQANLAEKLISIVPKRLNKVFFVNSGAEAVENAIKLAYRNKSISYKISPDDLYGVSCYGAFHGRTLGALTFTYSKPVQKKGYPELKVKRIKFCTSDEDENIDEIKNLLDREADEIAFVITEIVQGEGGYNIASKKFIQNLRKETERYKIPLIIDEVQSGLGRTGKWWAFEHYDIEPDIMSVGKALQVGATVFNEKYDPKERSAISSTWGGGDRIDMAIGLKIIEIIEREKLLKNAEKVGNYILDRIKELEKEYPQIITGTRGLGLMIAVDFNTKENRDFVEKKAFEDGLLLLGCGEKTIRIAPPLIITEEEVDKGLEIFEAQIRKLIY
jgi:4-aminobutyrate aminotransferase